MLRNFNPMAGNDKSFSWWWLGVKVGVITALVIWWWLDQKNKKQLQQISGLDSLDEAESIPLPDEALQSEEAPQESEISKSAAPTPSEPDDLRKIEGIGPKIQATLQAAGIETFAQLAAHKPGDLKQILVDAGIRIGYPDTWPEQAALAAGGEWDKLATLQNSLKGGRRS
jgi:predicted flap endonuclease-1-like 5' DNA nuclease